MGIEILAIRASGMTFSALADGPVEGPLILFLHGFPQFADAWTDIIPAFAKKGFRAVAVDQRGYSSEARPDKKQDYGIEYLMEDVLNIADALNAKRFHLVGHDWGGVVGWHLAGKAPHRLVTFTSLSTPHPSALQKALLTDWDQRTRSLYIVLFCLPFHAAEHVLKAQDWKGLRKLYQNHVSAKNIDRNIGRLKQGGCLTAALNWYRAYHGKAALSEVPTLFIWGSKDSALGRTAALATSRFVKKSYRLEILEGFSHWLLDEAPDEIVTLLEQHVTGP